MVNKLSRTERQAKTKALNEQAKATGFQAQSSFGTFTGKVEESQSGVPQTTTYYYGGETVGSTTPTDSGGYANVRGDVISGRYEFPTGETTTISQRGITTEQQLKTQQQEPVIKSAVVESADPTRAKYQNRLDAGILEQQQYYQQQIDTGSMSFEQATTQFNLVAPKYQSVIESQYQTESMQQPYKNIAVVGTSPNISLIDLAGIRTLGFLASREIKLPMEYIKGTDITTGRLGTGTTPLSLLNKFSYGFNTETKFVPVSTMVRELKESKSFAVRTFGYTAGIVAPKTYGEAGLMVGAGGVIGKLGRPIRIGIGTLATGYSGYKMSQSGITEEKIGYGIVGGVALAGTIIEAMPYIKGLTYRLRGDFSRVESTPDYRKIGDVKLYGKNTDIGIIPEKYPKGTSDILPSDSPLLKGAFHTPSSQKSQFIGGEQELATSQRGFFKAGTDVKLKREFFVTPQEPNINIPITRESRLGLGNLFWNKNAEYGLGTGGAPQIGVTKGTVGWSSNWIIGKGTELEASKTSGIVTDVARAGVTTIKGEGVKIFTFNIIPTTIGKSASTTVVSAFGSSLGTTTASLYSGVTAGFLASKFLTGRKASSLTTPTSSLTPYTAIPTGTFTVSTIYKTPITPTKTLRSGSSGLFSYTTPALTSPTTPTSPLITPPTRITGRLTRPTPTLTTPLYRFTSETPPFSRITNYFKPSFSLGMPYGFTSNILKGGRKVVGYTPSFTALAFGIRGKRRKKGEITGVSFRPITKGFRFPTGAGGFNF